MNNIRKIIEERLEQAELSYSMYQNDESYGAMLAYQDCLNLLPPTPRTEQEILNDFEKLGYEVKDYGEYITFKLGRIEVMDIWKTSKSYEIIQGLNITMQEHKLLNELFICWGWL